jgi:subtilisin family serine protease
MTRIAPVGVAVVAALFVIGTPSLPALGGETAEVVVLLSAPPLARAPGTGERLDAEQHAFREELARQVPSARVGWRYRLVANGFSLTLPKDDVARVGRMHGVRDVLPAGSYAPQAISTPQQIGAPALWGPTLDTAGQGVKIGIIDSGIDAEHPYFDPAGYTMPPGFPKGQQRFTTAKVIVARSFAPRTGATAPSVRLAFSQDDNTHGTHVAGIAAGNADTPAEGRRISGVAPRAYLGNYKVFVETDDGLSPNANSPAIVAAIEAAVADGMDVINFSGGEPEIEPSRDIVARALDAAAAAGVVPVVAAGNDYADFGAGSVSSPANSARAIAVGAVEITGTKREHASFSSVGPTTISLRLKPDVAAPGVDVLSSVSGGGWAEFQGTSMASPHVAGAAALLRQRHPAWTVKQVKSALVQSGVDSVDERGRPAGPRLQGGGVVALQRADRPLLFAEPTAVSFGLMTRGQDAMQTVSLEDAGGGAGTWNVARAVFSAPGGRAVRLTLPPTVTVPGELNISAYVGRGSAPGDLDAYVELRRGADVRRVPVWARVTAGALARHKTLTLGRAGLYRGTTLGQGSFVTRYRYPENPGGVDVTTTLRGPERVFRLRLTKRVANFGVVIVHRGRGSRVEPRVVAGLDENRMTGYAGLPINHNPYMNEFREPILAAGALSPSPGTYAVAFDSASRAGAGSFRFRYWVNDVTPPTLRLRTRSVARKQPVRIAASDTGAGVYQQSIVVLVDGSPQHEVTYRDGVIRVPTSRFASGTHRLSVSVSDYQESKNTENVARILPNTRTLTTTFQVR